MSKRHISTTRRHEGTAPSRYYLVGNVMTRRYEKALDMAAKRGERLYRIESVGSETHTYEIV